MSTVTSPETEGDSGLQCFVFGNAKPQMQHIEPEDAEPADYRFKNMLCLRRTSLKQVPDTVLRNSSLTYLCLEGNQITSIPGSLFVCLPQLDFIDLRKNLITSLPVEIGSHRCLRTLALEDNPISQLPPELGSVTTLRNLLLRDCPISFPPQDIVHQGCLGILQYLRSVLAKRAVNARTSPAVEKLQLSEVIESNMDEQEEESEDEDEMKKFRELKDKFNQLEIATLGSAAQRAARPKLQLPVAVRSRRNTTTKAGIIPELPLSDTRRKKSLQEKRLQAPPQTFIQARRTQDKKMSAHKQKRQRKPEETDSKPSSKVRSGTSLLPACTIHTETETDRYTSKLEKQFHVCAEKIQETHRQLRTVKKEDVDEIGMLQKRLLERKRQTVCEKCLFDFTKESWQSFFF